MEGEVLVRAPLFLICKKIARNLTIEDSRYNIISCPRLEG